MEKKKISIITIQYAHNYGAVLQAYSLKTVLEQFGFDVEIVNYIPKRDEKKYQPKLKNEITLKHAIRHFKLISWLKGNIETLCAQKEWNIRYNNFIKFINYKLLNGNVEKITSINELEKNKTDFWITGSDQIWNKEIVGELNPIYYLGFETLGKRISYAASMGNVKKPTNREKEIIGKWLKNYDNISVREKPLKEMIINEYDLNDTKVVVDPCLLMREIDFKNLIYDGELEKEKFTLAYFISEYGLLKKNFEKIEDIDNNGIIEIHWKRQIFQKNKNQRNSLSIEEFLWYIKNSEIVYTDSFHGVIFSLLFHKEFYAVYEKNTRIDSLLNYVGLQNRHIIDIENKVNKIDENDWKIIDKKIDELRKNSLSFLKNSL